MSLPQLHAIVPAAGIGDFRSFFFGATFLAAIFLTIPGSRLEAADVPKAENLFDGKTLQGWEGNSEVFHVRDGAIVGGSLQHPQDRNEFLCTKRSFGDFELRLQVKLLGAGANAGVQFRTKRIPDHHEVSGYQADAGEGWWGKLYDESRRNRVLVEPAKSIDIAKLIHQEDWNDYVVRCEGRHIQIWVNGTQTVDYREEDSSIPADGIVGVQIHAGPASEAWYRNIRIQPLPPSKP